METFGDAIEFALTMSGDPDLVSDLRGLLDERDALIREVSDCTSLVDLRGLLADQEGRMSSQLEDVLKLAQLEEKLIAQAVEGHKTQFAVDVLGIEVAAERLRKAMERSPRYEEVLAEVESTPKQYRVDAPEVAGLREMPAVLNQLVGTANSAVFEIRRSVEALEESVASYRSLRLRKELSFHGVDLAWDIGFPLLFFVVGLPTMFMGLLAGFAASLFLTLASWATGRWILRPWLDAKLLVRRKRDLQEVIEVLYVRLISLRCCIALQRQSILQRQG